MMACRGDRAFVYTSFYRCILLDSTGYVIAHYGMVEAVKRKTEQPTVENIHITSLVRLCKCNYVISKSCIEKSNYIKW